jgi:hypothetical protein
MSEQIYEYRWGNNKDAVGRNRLQFKGRKCRLLKKAGLNSCFVQFIDTGENLNCSCNAIRKAKNVKKLHKCGDGRPVNCVD